MPVFGAKCFALPLELPVFGEKRFLVLPIMSESSQYLRQGIRGVV